MILLNRILTGTDTTPKQLLANVVHFGVVILFALGLYGIIFQLSLFLLHQPYSSEYLGGFYRLEWSKEYFSQALPLSFSTLLKYYGGDRRFYYYPVTSLAVVFALCVVRVVCGILLLPTQRSLRFLALIILFTTLACPATMLLINGGSNPSRTMVAVVFALGGLVFLAASHAGHILRSVLVALCIICYIDFVIINQRYALASQLVWQADRDFSSVLLDRISRVSYKLPPRDYQYIDNIGVTTKRYPLEIVGAREPYPESPLFIQRETIGASFYGWENNETRRQVSLFATMGNFYFWPASRTERRSVMGQALAMPAWPDAGAVDVVNGIVVVKLGNYNREQIQAICAEVGVDDNISCQQLQRDPGAR